MRYQHPPPSVITLIVCCQLCFLHPSKYKFEHPRFCLERLEYVGQKIQVILFLFFAPTIRIDVLDSPLVITVKLTDGNAVFRYSGSGDG